MRLLKRRGVNVDGPARVAQRVHGVAGRAGLERHPRLHPRRPRRRVLFFFLLSTIARATSFGGRRHDSRYKRALRTQSDDNWWWTQFKKAVF